MERHGGRLASNAYYASGMTNDERRRTKDEGDEVQRDNAEMHIGLSDRLVGAGGR